MTLTPPPNDASVPDPDPAAAPATRPAPHPAGGTVVLHHPAGGHGLRPAQAAAPEAAATTFGMAVLEHPAAPDTGTATDPYLLALADAPVPAAPTSSGGTAVLDRPADAHPPQGLWTGATTTDGDTTTSRDGGIPTAGDRGPALPDSERTPAPHRTRRVPVRPVEGLLLGLAAGDAAGWPAARHRAARMPEWTRRLTRELDTFAEQNSTTTLPVPIALNQPPEPLRLGPSDDAEWAAFAAETVLIGSGHLFAGLAPGRRMRAAVDLAWNSLAGEVAAAADRAPEVESAVLPLRARISVRAGLGNLATGLRPPATGHDNPHYFDDAACVRAAVLAVVHPGDPAAAAELAEFDARYTQDGDGVHGARAMAAAVAVALGGGGVDDCVDAALAELPESTEIGRNARHAVKLARDADAAFDLVPLLEHQIVDHVYSYGVAAAETVPVALAVATAARGRVAEAVPAAACLSRVADSAPALAGALTGALGGGDAVPASWRDACRTLAGCALPRLAGTDLVELAGLLANTELTAPGGQFRHDDDTRDAHTR
ncbi:ADP-ribosylglycohydrolase family protein [Streptomyces sp. CA-251247]|uniref:ADP-ribosylglycohydrolase family protein n=1 Tax=Streptomyces sp. CA-251247 TaxID=3240062 RepID=UPI003D94A0C0